MSVLLLKLVLVIIWFVLIPFCVGLSLTGKKSFENNSFWMNMLLGYFGMFALFQVLCVPMTFMKISFTTLCLCYGGMMFVWAAAALIAQRKRVFKCSVGHAVQIGKMPVIMWIALLLIAVQIAVYVVGMSTDQDDALYVAVASTSIETDGIFTHNCYTGRMSQYLPKRYVLSPFPVFLGFISQAVQLHPTVVAHTIMPVFLVAIAYAAYSLLGRKLFQEDLRATGLFLCFLSLVHMFSYYSVYTQGTFMLIRIWQGKATLAAVLLPMVFYLAWQIFTEKSGWREWLWLLLLMLSSCLVSSMGIMLAPVMLGILALVLGIFRRQWKSVFFAFLCCLPCAAYAGIYLIM